MALAHAARAHGGPDRARALLQSVLADHPAHFQAQREMVRLLIATGDLAAARAMLAPLMIAQPGDGGLLIDYAALLRQEGDLQAAEAALGAVSADDSNLVQARLALGRLLRSRGAINEALAAFQEARTAAPDNPAALAESAQTLLDAGQAPEALAMIAESAARRSDEARFALLEAEALRHLGRRAEAAQRLEAAPSTRDVIVHRLIDRSALDRPARFLAKAQPGVAESGAALADALAGAASNEARRLLARVARQAHPLTVVGTAKLLLARWTDPELRLAAVQAAAHAYGTMGAARSALMSLDNFAAEPGMLPSALRAQLATRLGNAMLATGGRASAAEQFAKARALAPADPEANGLLGMMVAGSDQASAEGCFALLSGAQTPPRLRPWLADRAAPLLGADDPRVALVGLPVAERIGTEALLRHNIALAHGDSAGARALLAGVFAHHGVACPQPEGAPPGMAWFACPSTPPVDGPLVSVVISAHDAAPTLALALASVLDQSWRNLEVLVVDDASTDATAAIIAGFAERDQRVRPLGTPQNAGTYACRNLAIGAARGAFVTFHDADDWMHPRRIEIEMEAFSEPSVLAVNSRWFRMDAAGRVRFVPRSSPIYANPSFMLFRAEALRRLGCYDGVRASADTEMLWRARLVLGSDAIVVLPHVLTIGAARPDSLTTNSATGMDVFGFNALRVDYHEAYIHWHRACDADGVVPYLAPGAAPPYAGSLPEALRAGVVQMLPDQPPD
jgi:predicted Zn-dependent protease